jgi:dihydrolipoamide dehydrogenase
MTIRLGAKVTSAAKTSEGVKVEYEDSSGTQMVVVDKLVVAVGRRPFTDELFGKDCGIQVDERGFIPVDNECRTRVKSVFAVGDCVRGPMLAHKAMDEGEVFAEIIAGQSGHINYDAIPGIVYTWPEVASVGKTEEQLKSAGVAYRVGKFPFSANSRARCNDTTDGFVKILADAKTDRVLGAHIIGPDAGTLIHEIVSVIEFGGSAEDVARTCHGHPTLNEAVKEAALAVDGRAVHI